MGYDLLLLIKERAYLPFLIYFMSGIKTSKPNQVHPIAKVIIIQVSIYHLDCKDKPNTKIIT